MRAELASRLACQEVLSVSASLLDTLPLLAGYYATANGTCDACPNDYCKNCTSLTGECVACNRRWGAQDGVCRPCGEWSAARDVLASRRAGGRPAGAAGGEGRALMAADSSCAPLPCATAQELCMQCDGDVSRCTQCMGGLFADPATGRCLNCTDPRCWDCSEGGVDTCATW